MSGFEEERDEDYNNDFTMGGGVTQQSQSLAFDEAEPVEDSGEEHESEDNLKDTGGESEEHSENDESGL